MREDGPASGIIHIQRRKIKCNDESMNICIHAHIRTHRLVPPREFVGPGVN